jgi:aconitate hydratase
MSIIDASERYQQERRPLILVGGKSFGHGTGQEWAAKATKLLGIQAVLAESFAPLFRTNLIRVGVLPLLLKTGLTVADLNFNGEETIHFAGLPEIDRFPGDIMMTIERRDDVERYMVICDIKSSVEMDIYRSGSIWSMIAKSSL